MIDKKTYSEIASHWKGRIYQTYEEVEPRLKHFDDFVGLLHGRKVLEIGCNAAMSLFSFRGKYESYVGLEPNAEYYEQAQYSLKVFDRAKIYNTNLAGFIAGQADDFNALFASFSLYHLSDEEVDLLKTKILPKCNIALVYNRTEKRRTQKNSHKLYVHENAKRLLSECGFSVKTYWYKNKSFYLLVAEKR